MVLVAALGCGTDKLSLQTPVKAPEAKPSALTAVLGDYRLIDIDAEPVEAGELSIVDGEPGVGVQYTAQLSGAVYEKKVLTPKAKTTISKIDEKLHQKYEEGEDKVTVDYEASGSLLTIEVIECHPPLCIGTVLTAEKK
jgi:hypothetical protein